MRQIDRKNLIEQLLPIVRKAGDAIMAIYRRGSTEVEVGHKVDASPVTEGEADIYLRLAPTCEWDTAAAQAVLEGAGGSVVDLQDVPLQYGKPDVLNPSFIATRDTALIPT